MSAPSIPDVLTGFYPDLERVKRIPKSRFIDIN
jgi:hypothetical protein